MNSYVMFGVCFCILVVSLSLLLWWICITKKHSSWFKKLYLMIEVGGLSFLSSFCILNNHSYLILICVACYFGFVFIEKCVIGLLFGDRPESILWGKLFYLFVSPDYAFTDLQKELFSNKNEDSRARLIKINNIINILVTLLLLVVTISIKTVSDDANVMLWCNSFLLVRIVYRCSEIVLAFAKDIIEQNKKSSLSNSIRAKLAIVSFIETILLSVGYFYKKGLTNDLIVKSLSTIFFGDVCRSSVSVITAITGLVLISLVITQYLTKEEGPVLYIIDIKSNKLTAIKNMEQTDSNYLYTFDLNEAKGKEFIIKYEGIYFGRCHFKNIELQKESRFDNFTIEKSCRIKFNLKDLIIEIE